MYRPPESAHGPEPAREPDTEDQQAPDETHDLGIWLFSPIGAVLVWLIALGLIVPVTGIALLFIPEQYGQLAVGFGLWLTLGLAVSHWWMPPGSTERQHSEGLAVAGWHVLLTAGATGVFAWLFLFPDGRRPVFTLGDVIPVVVVGMILLVMFGTILTLLRGYLPGRGLRYAWTILCMLAVWLTLWLVAVHGGL